MSMNINVVPVILCGGVGSRLWPVSRSLHPKPFIKLEDGQSLLQKAWLLANSFNMVKNIVTVTNQELRFKIADEYNEIKHLLVHNNSNENPEKNSIPNNFIFESKAANTAPAIALAASHIAKSDDKNTILVILAADHVIGKKSAFVKAIDHALELAKNGKLVTFGIKPDRAETGYGYIEADGDKLVRFVEKPSLEQAESYVKSGKFLWNSGIFCFSVQTILAEMAKYCPKILQYSKIAIDRAEKIEDKDEQKIIIQDKDFVSTEKKSIDYAVMEKTTNGAVVACDIGWSDVGCWSSFAQLMKHKENNNHITGEVLIHKSNNCIIKGSNRLIATTNVDDLIIIDSDDALLVTKKGKDQEVKKIYEELKEQNDELHKHHFTMTRPWGSYKVLGHGPGFKVKQIAVEVAGRLSLQMHEHRSENWVIVQGIAKVTRGNEELILKKGQSISILALQKHRLENIGKEILLVIETQMGDNISEDDIVRFDDCYGRGKNEFKR